MANFAAKYSIMTQEMVDSFCDNFYIPAEVHPTALGRGKTITQFPVEMGLFDFIKTADPRKVQAVEVQKGDDQVTLLESTRHCFMPLVIPAGGSSSAAAAEVSAPTEEGQEDVAPEEAYLELADPDEGTAAVRQSEEEVVTEQPKKVKKKRLLKQSDVLPAKKLRVDHPTLVSGTGGKTLAGLEQIRLVGARLPDREQLAFHPVALSSQESEGFLDSSAQTNLRIRNTVERLLEEKDLEILRLKSQLAEKEAEAAEVIRLRNQVSSLFGEKYALTAEVSVLKVAVTQKDHDISLLNSRAACLASTLDDAKVACAEAGDKITSLASERDRLASEGILGHALGRAIDFGMQDGLEADYEHGAIGRNLSVVDAYNPESKKDAGMDEVLDCFLLDGPIAGLPKAAYLQPCIEQISIPIHHVGDNTAVRETSLSFALMNVHARVEGAKKHAAALCQLMMEIVLRSCIPRLGWGGLVHSVALSPVEDYDEEDTDEALGSVVALAFRIRIAACSLFSSLRSKFISKDSSFFIKSTSAVRSVGMPISAGMTASVPYVSENGVSPLLDLIMVRCAHRTCESSPIQSLLLSSNQALIPSSKLLFALSTKPFVCGCFTEAKHWRIHSFSHQSLNGLS
ncbi:hypothetical protein Tco_0245790 [Tanacetum coccineum]